MLLLFDPTRGIDVGTKHELYRLIRAYADAGGAVLFHSTEIPELVHLSDRALVFYAGRVARRDLRRRADRGGDPARRARRATLAEGGVTMAEPQPRSGAPPAARRR